MEVIRLSSDLKAYLDCSHQKVLTVYSVFPGAINLVDQENNLAALLEKKNMGPMSAVVALFHGELEGVCPGDQVLIEAGGLKFMGRDLFLGLGGAALWEVGLGLASTWEDDVGLDGTVNDLAVQVEALRLIREVIIEEEASVGIGALIRSFDLEHLEHLGHLDHWILPKAGSLNVYCDFIMAPLMKLLEALICKDFELFLELLPTFIGFGPGLTPSTDDFLAGVMISLYYEDVVYGRDLDAKKKLLWRIYQESIGRTTLVSQNMLKHAALGCVSEDHQALVYGLFFRSSDSVERLAKTVAKHGASSGVDFLFGFYCMNKIRVAQGVKET